MLPSREFTSVRTKTRTASQTPQFLEFVSDERGVLVVQSVVVYGKNTNDSPTDIVLRPVVQGRDEQIHYEKYLTFTLAASGALTFNSIDTDAFPGLRNFVMPNRSTLKVQIGRQNSPTVGLDIHANISARVYR